MVRGEGPADGAEVVEVVAQQRLVGDLGLRRDGVEVGDDGLNGAGRDAAHHLAAGLVSDALGKVGLAASSALKVKNKSFKTSFFKNIPLLIKMCPLGL